MILNWQHRDPPLEAGALWLTHAQKPALIKRLSAFNTELLAKLSFALTEEGIFLTSTSPTFLPWIDQVLWLGKECSAPDLWLPTLWQPDIPTPLLMQACLVHTLAPTAVIPPDTVLQGKSSSSDGTLMVSLQNLQAIELGQLSSHLAGHSV